MTCENLILERRAGGVGCADGRGVVEAVRRDLMRTHTLFALPLFDITASINEPDCGRMERNVRVPIQTTKIPIASISIHLLPDHHQASPSRFKPRFSNIFSM